VIWGLAAAVLWGVADFSAALLSRRLRAIPVVVIVQGVGAVGLGLLWFLVRPPFVADATEIGLLVVNGVVAAAAYVALYEGLGIGPVALVSPIAASYALVSIGLSMLLLGERLGPALGLGAAITLAGVVLASSDVRGVHLRDVERARGVPYALAAAVLFGVATFILGRSSRELGWLTAIAIGRGFTFLASATIARWRRTPFDRVDRRGFAVALGLGVVDLLGIAAYAWGSEVALLSLVIAASATFPLVSVAGGILVLGERPARSQFLGVGLVVAGLVALGLAS
jgi:drug/metabolite transporter (DMT)-like permease